MSEKQTSGTIQIQQMQARFRAGKFVELSKRIKNMRQDLDRTIEWLSAKAKEVAVVEKQEVKVAPKTAEVAKKQELPKRDARPAQKQPQGQVRTRQFDAGERRPFDRNRQEFAGRSFGAGSARPAQPGSAAVRAAQAACES